MQDLTTQLRSFVLPTVLGLALLGLGVQGANAQEVQAPSTWTENIGTHLAENLTTSSSEQIRVSTMRLIIRLKSTYGDAVDLSATAPALLELSGNAEQESVRILAITALYETGDARALQALAEQVRTAPPSRVRAHAVRILAAHQRANQAG